MKKLNKTQLTLFISSTVSLILDFVIQNNEVLGISSKIVILVTLLHSVWQLYNSYAASDMVKFANDNTNNSISAKSTNTQITTDDLNNWMKNQ